MTLILDGKAIAAEVKDALRDELSRLEEHAVYPKLVVVLIGDNPASASYVRGKERMASELGITAVVERYPETVSQAEMMSRLAELNDDPSVDGILVQLPLPAHLDTNVILRTVHPDKDVDGFHPYNIGRYASAQSLVWPCTSAGILAMLERRNIEIGGKTAVVVGRSQIVGWPTAQLLLANHATVIQCHSRTADLRSFTRQADILVVAVGVPGLIGREDVKPGATVIDVGMNRVGGKLVGDVDFTSVAEVAGAITPVPGGVGPMTVIMLMYNTILLAKHRRLVGGGPA